MAKKIKPKKLEEVVYKTYEDQGVNEACEVFDRLTKGHGDYEYCDGCQDFMPSTKGTCLICGQPAGIKVKGFTMQGIHITRAEIEKLIGRKLRPSYWEWLVLYGLDHSSEFNGFRSKDRLIKALLFQLAENVSFPEREMGARPRKKNGTPQWLWDIYEAH